MFEEGLIDEVKGFYDQNINTKEIIKKNCRKYAKRQYTWFKNQMNINWIEVDFDNFDNTIKESIKLIEKEKDAK